MFFYRDKLDKSQCALSQVYALQSSSTLVVPSRHLMRNIIVHYVRLWHAVAGATCSAIHISEPLPQLGKDKKRKRGTMPGPEQLEDSPLFEEPLSFPGGRRRGG